jgi:hypothetical protein
MQGVVCCQQVVLLSLFFNINVTADHYVQALQEESLQFLHRMVVSFREILFQQERSQPHTGNTVMDMLSDNFYNIVLSEHFPEHFGDG